MFDAMYFIYYINKLTVKKENLVIVLNQQAGANRRCQDQNQQLSRIYHTCRLEYYYFIKIIQVISFVLRALCD